MLNSVWAIVISIIVGVASNLLTPYVKQFLANVSKLAKERNEQKKLVFDNTVKYILENSNEEIILRIRYLQRGFSSFIAIIIGFVFMVNENGFLIIMGFIFSIFGYWGFSKANKLGKILETVTLEKYKNRSDIDLDIPAKNKKNKNGRVGHCQEAFSSFNFLTR